jgi:uncharacterized protein
MLLTPTIPKARSADPGLDQQQLFARGLQHVRQLARRVWTDHNVHDPGITTLELLCYALTDLSYRAGFPVEDLLASQSDNAAGMARQFFTAGQILPNRPLTSLDYRKLLIDLDGVKNAWILPEELTYYADTVEKKLLRERPALPGIREVEIRGLYRVLLDFMDEVRTPEEKDEVKARAWRRLHANRNLCEDFVGVDGVETQDFILCAELELAQDADTALVQARILFEVQRHLDPPVYSYSLSEMLERYTIQEIFDGPLLEHGFIDDEELARAELRTVIRLSDVISILMDIEGVRAVRDVVINPKGTAQPLPDKWQVPVAAGKRPALSPDGSRLVFYKRHMPVTAPKAVVDEHLARLNAEEQSRLEEGSAGDLPIPLGRYRQPARYTSFQNHFPAVYGLGEAGLPSGADARRRALADQLKGYLLFFDQVMAEACAQLAHLPELFSTDPDVAQTYFSQIVDTFAGFERIYRPGTTAEELARLSEDEAARLERRNRFLDHLLARFAERFHDYVAVMRSAFGASAASIVRDKCDFLKNYPALGGERGLAFDAGLREPADLWDTANVSGLERRIGRLLGLDRLSRRDLSTVPLGSDAEVLGTPEEGFRFRLRVDGKVLLSSNSTFATEDLARRELARALELAQLDSAYERKVSGDGKHFFNVVDGRGTVAARRFEFFATPELRDAAIDELIAYLRQRYSGEGMFLIENLLLRPQGEGDPFLPICVDPNCTDCADDDPYSYRLHVVLPAYAGRFANMDFRRFAEEVIREETPAHILPKICWIARDDMERLEGAYREWLENQEKLEDLIGVLYSVKNVYPSEKLHACDDPEVQAKFILGRTALGSGTGGPA